MENTQLDVKMKEMSELIDASLKMKQECKNLVTDANLIQMSELVEVIQNKQEDINKLITLANKALKNDFIKQPEAFSSDKNPILADFGSHQFGFWGLECPRDEINCFAQLAGGACGQYHIVIDTSGVSVYEGHGPHYFTDFSPVNFAKLSSDQQKNIISRMENIVEKLPEIEGELYEQIEKTADVISKQYEKNKKLIGDPTARNSKVAEVGINIQETNKKL